MAYIPIAEARGFTPLVVNHCCATIIREFQKGSCEISWQLSMHAAAKLLRNGNLSLEMFIITAKWILKKALADPEIFRQIL